MKPTEALKDLGQSLWLDNITRSILDSGELARYIDQCSVTGLTSNPSIFDKAIASGDYDDAMRVLAGRGAGGEELFFELAAEDIRRAADLFLGIHERSEGLDGWVSLEVSPLLAHDADATVMAARSLHEKVSRPNLMIKIPGTTEGLVAVERCIAEGIAVNVTLLFSAAQYQAAADAYLRGVEHRVAAGVDPAVGSVASVFISRWDVAIAAFAPSELRDHLGLTVGLDVYRSYRQILDSPRYLALANPGARPQRVLWASTATKDPGASDTLYIQGLAAPLTINTMPGPTLEAFMDHGVVGEPLPIDGGNVEQWLARFTSAGMDVDALAIKLQDDGAAAFVADWQDLLTRIDNQTASVKQS
jgi:transaldolase